jgi:hydroxymethylglutaryl-CoA reductase (NADPH)
MRRSDLQDDLEEWLRADWGQPDLLVEDVRAPGGLTSELAAPWRGSKYRSESTDQVQGVLALDLTLREVPGAPARALPVILKARTRDGMGRTLLPGLFERAGLRLSRPLEDYPAMTEFLTCGNREIAIYRLQAQHEAFRRLLPARQADRVDPNADTYLLMIERIADAALMDSADDISDWRPGHLTKLVDALAALHAVWLGRTGELTNSPWPPQAFDSPSVLASRELWLALLNGAARSSPDLLDAELHARCSRLVDTLDAWYPEHDQLPRTIVHDDFNARNACFRSDGTPLVYDWELTLVDIPQRDLAELLTFCLDPEFEDTQVRELAERHRLRLAELAGVDLDAEAWWEGLRLELRFEAINRLALQLVFRTDFKLGYVPRIVATVGALLRRYG